MNRVTLFLVHLSILALPACSFSPKIGDSTTGAAGKLSFSYSTGLLSSDEDFDCAFGCALDQAVVPGSTHRIDIEGDGASAAAAVDSSNPDVAGLTFVVDCSCEKKTSSSTTALMPANGAACEQGWTKTCRESATFAAGDSGEATLTVKDANGHAIDSTTLRVVAPVRAELRALDSDKEPLEVLRIATDGNDGGVPPTLQAAFFDGSGEHLRTSKAVSWSADDPDVALVQTFFSSPTANAGSTVFIQAVAPGEAVFRARVGNVEATTHIHVTR